MFYKCFCVLKYLTFIFQAEQPPSSPTEESSDDATDVDSDATEEYNAEELHNLDTVLEGEGVGFRTKVLRILPQIRYWF